MPVEKRDPPVVQAKALPDAVPEHEAGIEHRHLRLGAADELAVDADEDVVVARVADVVLAAGGGVWVGHGGIPGNGARTGVASGAADRKRRFRGAGVSEGRQSAARAVPV